MITPITQKPRPLRLLVRQPDGSFAAQPYRKTDDADRYVEFRKFDREKEAWWIAKMEEKWKADKKRSKAEAKARKKTRTVVRDRQRADAAAMQRNLELNKSDIITIAKSIISAGADAQPGVTSAILIREIQKRADAAFADQPFLSAAQRFARYTANPEGDGAVLLKASRRAAQEALDSWDDDDHDEAEAADNGENYDTLTRMARDLMEKRPELSFPQAFEVAYSKHPELARMTKADHATRIVKAIARG